MFNFFSEPVLTETEKIRRGQILYELVLGSAGLLNIGILIICFLMPQHILRWTITIGTVDIISLCLLYLNKKGHTWLGSLILVISYFILILGLAWGAGGINAPVIQYFPVIVLFAVLLLGRDRGILFGLLAIIGGFGLVLAGKLNVLPVNTVIEYPLSIWINSATCIGLIILLGSLYMDEINKALRKAQEELSLRMNSESRLKSISDNFTGGMIYQVVIKPNGSRKFTYLSDSVKQLYGITPDEGMKDADLIYSRVYEDDIKLLTEAQEESLRSSVTFKAEVRVKDPSGKIRWSSFISTPTLLEDGSTCFDGIEFIITKAKQEEEVLRENEERFRELSSVTQEGIMIHERGVIVDANQAFAELIGMSNPDNLIGKNGLEIIPFMPESRQIILDRLKSNTTETVEIKLIRSDGLIIPAETHGKDIKYRGRPARVVSMRDITYRKQVEERLQKLSSAVEQGPAAVIITNKEGEIEYVNQKFCEITGYSKEEIAGKNPSLLKSGHHDKKFYDDLWNTLLSEKNWNGEILNKRKNGELYWESALISPLLNKSGEITHFVAIKEDITDKKKLISELIKAKEAAESANKLKDAFIANISHEIRTPLTGLLGTTYLIRDMLKDKINEEDEELFEGMEYSSKRLIRTVDMILNYSRLQVGEFPIRRKEISVSSICITLFKEYSILANLRSLGLKFQNDCGDGTIFADEYSITLAISNLIENAIKYTKAGNITVTLFKAKNDDIMLEVKDTGIGIDKEYLEKVFEPYRQEQMGYGRAYEGVGLGLSLAKQFLTLNNANIFVESKKGEGTTFSINFGKRAQPLEKMISANGNNSRQD